MTNPTVTAGMPTEDENLDIFIQLLTDPENQPHQYVGYPDELRESLTPRPAVDVEKLKGQMLGEMACQSEVILCFDTLEWAVNYLQSKGHLK